MYSATFEFDRLVRSVGARLASSLSPCHCTPADPWKALVPLLVTVLTTPPSAPPNSAV